ncbi:MAG: PUA domain-containing protein, partial [Methanosarcinales archaeon]
MKRKVYLGKLVLNWCPKCNVPVLDSYCNKCKGKTKKVDITPPGDIRPAFPYDIEYINKTTLNQFNSEIIPNNNIVILNKVPYDDKMYEIIMNGAIIGAIRYELEKRDWIFIPRIIGAKILFSKKENKKWVIVDNGAIKSILKGANVLAPGVEDADQEISSGDEVIVIGNSEVIATGRARMSGKEMIYKKHGLAVKVRWNKEKNASMPKSRDAPNWKEVVNANLHILKKIESKAHSFIKKVADNVNKPVSVSYSGGKDSLATLLLVKEVLKE